MYEYCMYNNQYLVKSSYPIKDNFLTCETYTFYIMYH